MNMGFKEFSTASVVLLCGLFFAHEVTAIKTGRVGGGFEAMPNQFDYLISIQRNGSHVCGGGLVEVLRNVVVLTAAQCVESGEPSDYTVIGGLHSLSLLTGTEQYRQVTRIIKHENYTSPRLGNDIAILFIHDYFAYNGTVGPVRLPAQDEPPYDADVGVVVGWGATQYGGGLSDTPNWQQPSVVEDSICQERFSNETILSTMICTGVSAGAACHGDEGGPMRSGYGGFLLGIISWTNNCSGTTVRTEVPYFVDWIRDKVLNVMLNP